MKADIFEKAVAQGASAIQEISAEIYVQCNCALGECPVWHDGVLYWTDISGKIIFEKPEGSPVKRHEMEFEVGAFALWKKNQIVLAGEQGFHSCNLITGELELWADPENELPNNRFNDGKCDPSGRFVAGTLNRNGAPEAALYVLDSNKSVRELYRPVTCSNGLAWSENGTVFYYIDTPTGCVRAFDYDLEQGRLSNERVVIKIPESLGRPDGMTIDRDGNLWIALWNGWGVECWNPNTGKHLARIEVPTAHVTSCVFGGERYDTLFITTARKGLNPDALSQQKFAGSVFCSRPGMSGFPPVHFKNAN